MDITLFNANTGLIGYWMQRNNWAVRQYGRDQVDSALKVALLRAIRKDPDQIARMMWGYAKEELLHLRIENLPIRPPTRKYYDHEFIAELPHVQSMDELVAYDETDHKLPVSLATGRDPTFDNTLRWQRFEQFTGVQRGIVQHKLEGENNTVIASELHLKSTRAVEWQTKLMKQRLAA